MKVNHFMLMIQNVSSVPLMKFRWLFQNGIRAFIIFVSEYDLDVKAPIVYTS